MIETWLSAYGHQDKVNVTNMVESLLEFIRAERDDNWTLHLEVFSVMLPWLTIYVHTSYAR